MTFSLVFDSRRVPPSNNRSEYLSGSGEIKRKRRDRKSERKRKGRVFGREIDSSSIMETELGSRIVRETPA